MNKARTEREKKQNAIEAEILVIHINIIPVQFSP
jgi:hypothetical protein